MPKQQQQRQRCPCYKKAYGMFFLFLKRSFTTLTPTIFLPLYKAFNRWHLKCAIQASSPFLFQDSQTPESVQKLAVKFVNEAALQQPRIFPLGRRRIRGDYIYMYKIAHGPPDFPYDAFLAAPTRSGRRRHAFNIREVPLRRWKYSRRDWTHDGSP